jgi:hypothetical protein
MEALSQNTWEIIGPGRIARGLFHVDKTGQFRITISQLLAIPLQRLGRDPVLLTGLLISRVHCVD